MMHRYKDCMSIDWFYLFSCWAFYLHIGSTRSFLLRDNSDYMKTMYLLFFFSYQSTTDLMKTRSTHSNDKLESWDHGDPTVEY